MMIMSLNHVSKCRRASLLSFFRIDSDVHRHLFFYLHFRISFFKFPKISCWYFDASRIWHWIDRLRENWHLHNDKSSICQHGIYHHLFRSLCLIMELKNFYMKMFNILSLGELLTKRCYRFSFLLLLLWMIIFHTEICTSIVYLECALNY